MNRNLAKAREHICDDWVIDVTQQRSGYAECIIGLLEKALYKPVSVPVTLAMAERKRDIPGRIDMIVDNRRKTNTKVSGKALIAVFLIGCFCVPVIGGIGLVRFAGARPASHEGRIVFEKRDQNWNSSVWVMDANGENEKRLSDSGSDPAWSPDGRQIAFHIWNDGANDIWVMNADGANIKRLTNSPMLELDFGATWSPDGKQVAFTRSFWEEEEFKSSAICVVNADGTNERTLVKEKLIELRDLSWSPDGKKIVFARVQVWEGSIWVMDADGENEKKLAENGFEPCWSPDGGMIAFESSSGIFVMDADGGRQERLTPERDAWDDQHPTWSPDGTKIAFCSYERDKPSEMYVMNADGSNVQQLTNTPEYEFQPDWTAFSYAVEPAGKLKSTWGEIKRGLFGK